MRSKGGRSRDKLFGLPSTGKVPEFANIFRDLLDVCDLTVDPETGRQRVPYSLRHHYATFLLEHGEPDYLVAELMGSSIYMIHRHYSHVKVDKQAARISGAGRERLRRVGMMQADAWQHIIEKEDRPDDPLDGVLPGEHPDVW